MRRVLSHFYSLAVTVQTDCSEVSESDANIIFIEKRRSFSAILRRRQAKVDAKAYAPLLVQLAEEEMDVYLVKMPLNLAFFGIGKAGGIIEDSAYEKYYISGHSLGGAMAAGYAAEHESEFAGVILFAAYPTQETAIDTLVIYGSEDGVLNMARIAEAPKLVSGNYSEVVIDGGNHAQFGNYGEQKGDGEAVISAEDQQTQTIQAIREFVNGDSSDRLF